MKYQLSGVYRAMALDELYKLLCDETDLTIEDLRECEACRYDLGTSDIAFSDCVNLRDNLNVKPAQERLDERIAVLHEKIGLLQELKNCLINSCCRRLYCDLNDDPLDVSGLPI